jgi:integrase
MTHPEPDPDTDSILDGEIVSDGAALIPYEGGLVSPALAQAGQAANAAAAQGVFADYLARRSENTLRRQAADLRLFADFLKEAGVQINGDLLRISGEPWRGVTWGLVEAFKRWMLGRGYAIGSVNVRLSTIKTYARFAFKSGEIDPAEHAMIRQVVGFNRKESKRVDQKRAQTRIGIKKDEPTRLTYEQAAELKAQPDTPQGRRDALLMCLLLDHGLRCGEVALLQTDNLDLRTGTLRFYRPKVDKEQVHKLTADTLRAAYAWLTGGDAPAEGPLLRASRKGGELGRAGMTERAITKRVRQLGRRIGVRGLSAHDCRHYWATRAARSGTDPFALQEAGGWNSLAMPRRYVEDAKIANEGVKGF